MGRPRINTFIVLTVLIVVAAIVGIGFARSRIAVPRGSVEYGAEEERFSTSDKIDGDIRPIASDRPPRSGRFGAERADPLGEPPVEERSGAEETTLEPIAAEASVYPVDDQLVRETILRWRPLEAPAEPPRFDGRLVRILDGAIEGAETAVDRFLLELLAGASDEELAARIFGRSRTPVLRQVELIRQLPEMLEVVYAPVEQSEPGASEYFLVYRQGIYSVIVYEQSGLIVDLELRVGAIDE